MMIEANRTVPHRRLAAAAIRSAATATRRVARRAWARPQLRESKVWLTRST